LNKLEQIKPRKELTAGYLARDFQENFVVNRKRLTQGKRVLQSQLSQQKQSEIEKMVKSHL